MGLKGRILDGRGNPYEAGVTEDHALLVSDVGNTSLLPGTVPPEVAFTQFFDTVGDGTGSTAMNVVGSLASPQSFNILPDVDRDIVVNQIVLFLSDSQIQLKRFGFIPELTNGFRIILNQSGEITEVVPPATTNMNLIQFSGGNFDQFDNIDASNNDALLITYDFPQVEIRLVAGSLDSIECRVRDDLTGLVEFTALMRGKKLREAA